MQFRRQIETKPYEAFPNEAKDEIHLVSYNKAVIPDVVGSYAYRIQKYPADIDIMENVDQYEIHGRWEPATNSVQLIDTFAQRITEIMTNIKNKPHHYLLDFKAGADERYIFTLGFMANGFLQLDPKFIANLNTRAKAGLYTQQEYDGIIEQLRMPHRDQSVYEKVTNILRKNYVIRWSINEILAGVKHLRLGHTLTLRQALSMHQLVKMDMAALVNGRFMEVSNIWSFFFKSGATGAYTHMTPVPNLDNVPFDIEKFYWSDSQFSPFKVLKRIFSFARMKYLSRDHSYEDLIRLTAGIISGDTSAMYQVRSELDTIVNVIAIPGQNSQAYINQQVDGMKNRLANNLAISGNESSQFDGLLNMYLQSHNPEYLEQVMKILKKKINRNAMDFLVKSGMNPPPLRVLPTMQTADLLTREHHPINPFCPHQAQKTYNWSIIRDTNSGGAYGGFHAAMKQDDPEMYARLMRKNMIDGGCATCGGGIASCPCCHGRVCGRHAGDEMAIPENFWRDQKEWHDMSDAEKAAMEAQYEDPKHYERARDMVSNCITNCPSTNWEECVDACATPGRIGTLQVDPMERYDYSETLDPDDYPTKRWTQESVNQYYGHDVHINNPVVGNGILMKPRRQGPTTQHRKGKTWGLAKNMRR